MKSDSHGTTLCCMLLLLFVRFFFILLPSCRACRYVPYVPRVSSDVFMQKLQCNYDVSLIARWTMDLCVGMYDKPSVDSV